MEETVETAENSQIEESCRLCDQISSGKMISVFDKTDDGTQILQLIKENLPVIIYRTDPLSKVVCETCINTLHSVNNFKKTSKATQEKYKERFRNDTVQQSSDAVQLYLGCDNSFSENEDEELKDACTSTEDLTILCSNCKQMILDGSFVNGEVELCTDLHKAIAESLRKHRMVIETDSEKVLRKRKVQPIYQEFDDSLCSSLTEFTRNTELDDENFSQYGFESHSEVESEESDEDRPSKRRKIDENLENVTIKKIVNKVNEVDKDEEVNQDEATNKDAEDSNVEELNTAAVKEVISAEEVNPVEEVNTFEEAKAVEEVNEDEKEVDIEKTIELFEQEPEESIEPHSLLVLALNAINCQNVPDYVPEHFRTVRTRCSCSHCGESFKNMRLLALHEPTHISVEIEEKVDNPMPWDKNREDFTIRNKWLRYFDENGYDEDHIMVDVLDGSGASDPLLIPHDSKNTDKDGVQSNDIVLVDMKPTVNGVYLGDYTKEERKNFYQCLKVGGQTKRFCQLCRYCFKDNWAIESHYFSLACHYTCRYCGMRFNKQRPRFEEHIKEHEDQKHELSDKIFAASKVNNFLPKIVKPDKVREPEPEPLYPLNPPMLQPQVPISGLRVRNIGALPPYLNSQEITIKEEPREVITSQSKTGNQAYFCRKCYKVFFKLDEFNVHSKNCTYNQFPGALRHIQLAMTAMPRNPHPLTHSGGGASNQNRASPGEAPPPRVRNVTNGDVTNTGRPIRNCAKDVGPYKDEVYIPKELLRETVPTNSGQMQSFVCHICGTPFPTIYSRNSHMRIHKGDPTGMNAIKFRQRDVAPHGGMQQKYPKFAEVKIKQEPMDSFEPMVEIHEGESNYNHQPHHKSQHTSRPTTSTPKPPPSNHGAKPVVLPPSSLGDGAVSITPISKKPPANQNKPPAPTGGGGGSNVLRLVQNNPHLTIKKPDHEKYRLTPSTNAVLAAALAQSQSGNNGGNHGNSMVMDADRSYKCSSCWEAFANKSHLYFHKKNQCEGSRFPCPFCKKRFGTEAAYSSHIFYSHPE